MSPEPPPHGWPAGFAEREPDRLALLVLSTLNLPPRELHALVWRHGTAEACLASLRKGGLGPARTEAVRAASGRDVAERLAAVGARAVFPPDPDFPPPLLDLADPPAWIFVRGRWPVAGDAVAVVGARNCSPQGREVATAIGEGLAAAGVVVVSGGARGIDAAAHEGALRTGITVAVLGSGIDRLEPSTSRGLLTRMLDRGAVLSEYPPGARGSRFRFPARNRLVAALALATVVVEGGAGSGSLITAEHASDIGRDVMAVPGSVTSPLAGAPNALLRDGAVFVRGPRDILDSLSGRRSRAVDHLLGRGGGPPPEVEGLTDRERSVLGALGGDGATADGISRSVGLSVAEALSVLASLELRGLIRAVGGRYTATLTAG